MASTTRDEISRLELLHAAHPDGLVFPHLADAYRRAGRYAQAEDVLEDGLKRHENYSSAHVVLGRLRLDQGRHEEAREAFRRVLELDPQNHVAMEYLGRVSLEQGDPEAALEQFRRLARLKPSEDVRGRVEELTRRVEELRNGERPQGRAEPTDAPAPPSPTQRPPPSAVEPGPERAEAATQAEPAGAEDRPEPTDAAPPEAGADPAGTEPAGTDLPEPGEVVTETMAELYERQGLHERAAAVYRQLLERSPGDRRLRAKLEGAEGALAEERPGRAEYGTPPPDSASPEPGEAPAASEDEPPAPWEYEPEPLSEEPATDRPPEEPATEAPPEVEAPPSGTVPAGPGTAAPPIGEAPPGSTVGVPEPELEPSRGTARPEPPVPEPSGPAERWTGPPARTIKTYLGELLAWEPSEGEPSEGVVREGVAREADPLETPRSRAERGRAAATGSPGPELETSPRGSERASEGVDAWGMEPAPPAEGAAVGAFPALDGPTLDDTVAARERSLIAITDMLVGLLEYRDPFFRGSSSLTRLLARDIAKEMGLGSAEQADLALAAVLRDLGRLAMGGRLVPQSQQTRTPEARRRIERHVDLALDLLEGIEMPRQVRLAVRHHHERWDGEGYPDGLRGERIPLLARILAVADSFAAMISPRSYRLPRKVPDAAHEVQDGAGTQYDPAVVDALMRALERRDQAHIGFVQRPHLVLVNPDQPGAVVTAAKLCSAGYLAEVAGDPDTARERLRRVPVAGLVVSAENGEEEAAAFVREIRVDPLFRDLPVVVTEAETVALRVRMLESGADVCFPPGVTYAELQGTLGALVRRSVRAGEASEGGDGEAGGEAPWLALQGDIQDFPLTWLLQVMKYDSRTAAIGIRGAEDDGVIYLEGGDAIHAQLRDGPKGETALRRMLQWERGRFRVQPNATPGERSIETSIMHLLLTQAVDEDHAAAGIFGAVSDEG